MGSWRFAEVVPPEVLSEWQEELNPLEVRYAGVVLADPTTSVEPVLQHEKLVSQREDLGVAPVAGGEHLSEP